MTGSRPRAYDMTKRSDAEGGTRRRVAEAALSLFKERDYDDVSLNEIARAAGVSHQTVLNHCESKAGVLMAAGELFSEEIRSLEVDAVDRGRDLGGPHDVHPLRGAGRRQRPMGRNEHPRP